ncbi:phosphotransferase [Virgibacillus sp. DJP39]|uniref:phosphotransferase n=1 Tax=Virgibacillus sp. DJP39 TaxID=3409790 RepID=UPI003BB81238
MNTQLREKIGEIIGTINKESILNEQGCTSEVSKIITDSGSYLLKNSYNKRYREWLKKEALVLEKLKYNNLIQVPNYYGYIEEKASSHLIMSFEEGITLTSALNQAENTTEKKELIRSFGYFLHQFHQTSIMETLNQDTDWLKEQLVEAGRYVNDGQTDGSLQLLEKLQSTKLLPVQQTMIHGDCTTDNVLVVAGRVRLFIDVSAMTVGDPRYDESLAIRGFADNAFLKQSFYEGYTRYKVSEEEFTYFEAGLYEFF